MGRRVFRFDGDYAAEGCGGSFAASKKRGARLAPQVGADCVGRLCRKGATALRAEGDGLDCPAGNEYEVSVTGMPFVSPRVHDVVQKPSSSGRWESCRGLPSRANIRV